MAEMRHGSSEVSGYLYKKGRLGLRKHKMFFRLETQVLYCSPDQANKGNAAMELSLSGATVVCKRERSMLKIRQERRRWTLIADSPEECDNWFTQIQKAACSNVEDFYELGEKLGEGAFATVYMGLDKSTLEKFAVKIIDKGKTENEMEFIHRETRIMRVLDHPNVIRTFDVFDTKTHLHLVIEFMPGGTLADIMKNKVIRTERMVRDVMREILEGVSYLHKKHIVHRDLKLKNILCKNPQFPLEVKLADFGLSNNCGVRTISRVGLKSQVGSPHFVAPEVLREHPYGPAIDLWSCGVIMHLMLTGNYPFAGKTVHDTLELVCKGKFTMEGPRWDNVTAAAQEFVKLLLSEKMEDRPSADEALQHKWFLAANQSRRDKSVS